MGEILKQKRGVRRKREERQRARDFICGKDYKDIFPPY